MAEEYTRFEKQRNPRLSTGPAEREYGKFRESKRHTRDSTVAVVGDDGDPVGSILIDKLDELINEIRLLRFELELNGVAQAV